MQRSFVSLVLAPAVLIAGIGSFAWAQSTTTVLITPALQLGTPSAEEDFGALCMAINVSEPERQIQLVMFDGQGVRTAPGPTPIPVTGTTPSPSPTPIALFGSAILGDPGYPAPGSAAAGLRYCAVIYQGEPDDVRASLCVTDAATGRCVTSVEAR